MLGLLKWKTQIRKGYLDLCILAIIDARGRVYGFDLIERLRGLRLEIKEGTLYPLLSRLSTEGLLSSEWELKNNNKGHPRKFYSLTEQGHSLLAEMRDEFQDMQTILKEISSKKESPTHANK